MDIRKLFKVAAQQEASDLHLVVGLKPYLRIDGTLIPLKDEAVVTAETLDAGVTAILSEPQVARLRTERELDISYEVASGSRFRVNIHYEKDNLCLVARVILNKVPSLVDISMPQVVDSLLRLQQGLILVTGPTGCGKSTSLAAMIEDINQEQNRNIITLEDPIEFIFTPKKSIITQRQLATDMLSFKAGLKHIVRQDPDVVMVGEMRDLETIAATITLAETGHLVLATLHTYSAAQTIDRIIDIFPPHQQSQVKLQLSAVLAAVISQRLVPRVSAGRVAAREVLINTPAVANLIRESKISQISTVIETNYDIGMVTMDRALEKLAQAGEISEETAKAHSTDSLLI